MGAPVNDTSMALGQKDNLAQGQQFAGIHKTQHGGFWFGKPGGGHPQAGMKEMSVGKVAPMAAAAPAAAPAAARVAAPAAAPAAAAGRDTLGGPAGGRASMVSMAMKSMKGGSRRQRGGSAPYPLGVTNSTLEGPMIAAARTGPLDAAIAQTQGMSDQSGGRRRGKKGKKANRKSQKNRNVSRRRRNMRGGAHGPYTGSPLTADSMLLPSGLEKSAQLNSDWDAARNPNYWAPRE